MSFANVSDTILDPMATYITEKWSDSKQANFYEKQCLARGAFLGLAPLSFAALAIDTIIGIGSGIAAIATGGLHRATTDFAVDHLGSSKKLLSYPSASLLLAINPEIEFSAADNGYITDYVCDPLRKIAEDYAQSGNPFNRHVTSRLSYALLAVSALVARTVDGVIGMIALAFSFVTVGYFDSLNNLALAGLEAPGIINDLFFCTIKFINPWADGVRFGRFS